LTDGARYTGDHWIDYYDVRDATEVIWTPSHSEKGRKMYQRLPKSKTENVDAPRAGQLLPTDSQTQLNFRQLRSDLGKGGTCSMSNCHPPPQITGAVLTARSVPIPLVCSVSP
jgi:hypothetical protein